MMGTITFQLEQVSRAYGTGTAATAALRDVSWTVAPGEQWAVVGPSGSGKSTLLYLLGALDRPSAGRVWAGDRDLAALSPAARAEYRFHEVGFVFQDFQLVDSISVGENVLLPFVGRPRERRAAVDRAHQLLAAVDLADAWRKPAGVMSGGEKQRVALARALINDPRVLLCDEPTGNLDHTAGARVMDLLQSLARDGAARTLVVITHDPRLAARMDHQLHLRDGAVVTD